MTAREYLAKHYPLHFQRIVEIVYEQTGEFGLKDLNSGCYDINCAFVWYETPEGYDYWLALFKGAEQCA